MGWTGLLFASCIMGVHALWTTPQLFCAREDRSNVSNPFSQYILEEDCEPCLNGGMRQISRGVCRCVCPSRYAGEYCQYCMFYLGLENNMQSGLVTYPPDRTRISFKLRVIGEGTSYLLLFATKRFHSMLFGFCEDDSNAASITETNGPHSIGLPLFSGPLYAHCLQSRFDSYWISFLDGLCRLGIGGNAIPILTYQPKVNFTVKKVVFTQSSSGAEWMIDLPCAP